MDMDQAKIDLSGDMAAPAQPAATNVSRSGIVDELAELRERVDQAIERLSTGQAARRRLMTRQTDLEAKYEARSEELDHCGRRIEELTRENDDLMGLVDRLVKQIEPKKRLASSKKLCGTARSFQTGTSEYRV